MSGERVLVVGGGPAGLMAAIGAARGGATVSLFEQLEEPGKKLLTTGGGRCNLTNTLDSETFMARFGRQGRFMAPALENLDRDALLDFFKSLGVSMRAEDGFHYFPILNSAKAVRDALLKEMARLQVKLETNRRVTKLRVEEGVLRGVECGRDFFPADRVILATGGKSYPALGATGSGYVLAEGTGHAITEPLPALTPIILKDTWLTACAGIVLKKARLAINLPKYPAAGLEGDLLLTHEGLSGPLALDLSGEVAALLKKHPEVPLALTPLPNVDAKAWQSHLQTGKDKQAKKGLGNSIDQLLPGNFARQVTFAAGLVPGRKLGEMTDAAIEDFARLMTRVPLTAIRVGGFDTAMVTRGGVSLKEVAPKTLESKRLPGLYFAGELLDLDGPCGGYNLQWAFSSGMLAGQVGAGGSVPPRCGSS